MARKIVVTSGKGGVGKTTVTANLGLSLAGFKKKVLLCDLDLGLNNLDIVTGIEGRVVYDLCDVLDGRCRIRQAIVESENSNFLYVLPSGNAKDDRDVSGQSVKLLLESVANFFDFILIDCPAGIDVGFHRAVSLADEAIVIATPSLPSIRDANRVVSVLESYRLKKIDLIVNRARGDLMMDQRMIFPEDIAKILNVELLGVVPEEDSVFLSVGGNLPKTGGAYKSYKLIAENLLKGKNKVFDATRKYSGIIGSIRRKIRSEI